MSTSPFVSMQNVVVVCNNNGCRCLQQQRLSLSATTVVVVVVDNNGYSIYAVASRCRIRYKHCFVTDTGGALAAYYTKIRLFLDEVRS